MEERKDERNGKEFERFFVEDPLHTSLSLPENCLLPNTIMVSSPENHSIGLTFAQQHPEYHPFQAINRSPSVNAPDVYDPFLEPDFNRLFLSNSSPHQSPYGNGNIACRGLSTFHHPSAAGFGGVQGGARAVAMDGSISGGGLGICRIGGSVNLPISFPITDYTNENLQRMRVESAVRGQGMYMPHQGYPSTTYEAALNVHDLSSNAIPDHRLELPYNIRYNGVQNLVGSGNGFRELGYDFPTNSSRNRFRNIDTDIVRPRGRSCYGEYTNIVPARGRSCNGENENLGLMSSLYNRSPLHCNDINFSSLDEIKGKIFLLAKDQQGGRFLQKIFDEGMPEKNQIIFSEVKDHVHELMKDQFGNYLIQKMFEVCNAEQLTQLLLLVIGDERRLMDVCLDQHGTRAMQKLVENLTTPEQRSLVISVLRRITVSLTKDNNGHHVIQHCLKHFTEEDNKHILNVVADNCLDIATDKSGCCVLQQCVHHADGEPRDRLVAEITANALVLSEHPYGNYVVQYIIGLKKPLLTRDILAQLSGSYVSLSVNKYGSNVVEKCMKESSEEESMAIIKEIISSPNFLMVLQDPYGNYVAQSAYNISKGSIRSAMNHLIQMNYSHLHSHPHGKRVLARTKANRNRV